MKNDTKKRAKNPRKNIALNTEKNVVFTAERYSVVAEEAIQFTVNGRNILMEKKNKRSVNSLFPRDERRHSLSQEK
ncbi:hypothetical protein TNCV_2182811 [Trichonephila clavipes]|uniref:Uncharacterized protein n=1 Tax=Trichonephila clavipes TaxID=2585209 RepID=A0A8X6VV79_TRICX|nr:hypothetical protein TNCV_2182811 [Trichonephila clavipes]